VPSPFASFGRIWKCFLINIGVDKHCNLDIFEQIANKSEQMKKLVNMELFILDNTKWIWRKSNVFCNGGKNMNLGFQLWDFLFVKSWELLDPKLKLK
jgi:hypothetical protein